jgi:hypothetical protein
MIKQNFNYRVICCYCGRKHSINLIEDHMNLCIGVYQKTVKEEMVIRPEYEELFLKIRNGEFHLALKEKILEEFNKIAIRTYEEYYLLAQSIKNINIYKGRVKQIQKEIRYITNFEDIEKSIEQIQVLWTKIMKMKMICRDLKDLLCFICGEGVHFLLYAEHCSSCYQEKLTLIKDNNLIPFEGQKTKLKISNLHFLSECSDQLSKLSLIDKSYCNFLIKEYNLESKKIFREFFTLLKREGQKILSEENKSYSNSFLNTTTTITESSSLNTEPNSHSFKNLIIICFICGKKFETSNFCQHYTQCSELYIKSENSKKVPLEEPIFVKDLLEKIVLGIDAEDEIKIYNIFAENTFRNIFCKFCEICSRNCHKDIFEKHNRVCMERKNSMDSRPRTQLYSEQYGDNNNIGKIRTRKKSVELREMDIKEIRSNVKQAYFI